jgi:hypothetical protein
MRPARWASDSRDLRTLKVRWRFLLKLARRLGFGRPGRIFFASLPVRYVD